MKKVGLQAVAEKKKYCFNEHWKDRRLDKRHQPDLAKAVVQYCNKIVLLVSTVIRWQLLGARAAIISFCKRTVPYKPWNPFWFKLAWSFWANSFMSLSYSLVLCNQLPSSTPQNMWHWLYGLSGIWEVAMYYLVLLLRQ